MVSHLARFWRDQKGATAIEYCLIAGGISIAIVVGLTALGTKLSRYYSAIANGVGG